MNDKILSIIIQARNDTAAAFEKVNLELDALKNNSQDLDKTWVNLGEVTQTFGKVAAIAIGASIVSTAALGVVASATFAIFSAGLVASAGAILGIGTAAAATNQQVKTSFTDLFNQIKTGFEQAAQPLIPALQHFADQAQVVFKGILPSIQSTFQQFAPIVDKFGQGILQGFQNFTPAITDLMNTMQPVLDNLSGRMGDFGTFMAGQAEKITDAFGSVSSDFTGPMMTGLGNFINGLDNLIADLIKIGGPIIGPLLTALGNLATAFGTSLLKVFNDNQQAIIEITVDFVNLLSVVLQLIPLLIQLSVYLFDIAQTIVGKTQPAFNNMIKAATNFWDVNKNSLIPILKDLGALLIGGLVIELNLVFDAVTGVIRVMQDLSGAAKDAWTFLGLLWQLLKGGDVTLKRGQDGFTGIVQVLDKFQSAVQDVYTIMRLLWDTISGGDPTIKASEAGFTSFVKVLLSVRDNILTLANDIKIWLVGSWTILKKAVDDLMPSMKALADALVRSVIPAFEEIYQAVARLYNALQPALSDVLVTLAAIVGITLYAAIYLFINALRIAVEVLAVVIQALTDGIKWISNFIDWIGTASAAIGNFFGALPGRIGGIWDSVRNATKDLVNDLVNFFASLPDRVIAAIGNIGSRIGNDIKSELHTLHIPGFATGVNNFGGGVALVGEQGPEIVNLPRGSQVIPNKQSQQMMSGSTFNMYGTINLGSADAVDRFFTRLNSQKEMAALGVGI